MEGYSTVGWFALVLSVVLSGFAAAAQEAITPINQARLQHLEDQGWQRAKAIERLLDQSEVYTSSLLLLSVLAAVGAAAAATVLAMGVFGAALVADVTLALLLVFSLLLAQMTGKALALRDPALTGRLLERPLDALNAVLRPLARPAQALVGRLLHVASGHSIRGASLLNEEALYLMIGGAPDPRDDSENSEHAMIHRIIELEDKTAREIMVPRIDIAALPSKAGVAEVAALAQEHGHSRIPVYEGNLDNVVGILYVKDLLPLLTTREAKATARQLARPAYFVPESKHVDELLRELRQRRVHMAIVVDEYGGTAGLVTIEDLLEEIVGEIQDEYDQEEEERIQLLGEGEAIFAASVSVDDVNRALGSDLQADGFDTLGGLVYDSLGKVPRTGDTFVVGEQSLTVLATEGRRVRRVRVVRLEPEEAERQRQMVGTSTESP
ncbi:MAG: hemolysin family protein [Chloroflexota bacterium]